MLPTALREIGKDLTDMRELAEEGASLIMTPRWVPSPTLVIVVPPAGLRGGTKTAVGTAGITTLPGVVPLVGVVVMLKVVTAGTTIEAGGKAVVETGASLPRFREVKMVGTLKTMEAKIIGTLVTIDAAWILENLKAAAMAMVAVAVAVSRNLSVEGMVLVNSKIREGAVEAVVLEVEVTATGRRRNCKAIAGVRDVSTVVGVQTAAAAGTWTRAWTGTGTEI